VRGRLTGQGEREDSKGNYNKPVLHPKTSESHEKKRAVGTIANMEGKKSTKRGKRAVTKVWEELKKSTLNKNQGGVLRKEAREKEKKLEKKKAVSKAGEGSNVVAVKTKLQKVGMSRRNRRKEEKEAKRGGVKN